MESDRSLFLPNLTSALLEQFTNRGFTESPLIIEREFLKQIETA